MNSFINYKLELENKNNFKYNVGKEFNIQDKIIYNIKVNDLQYNNLKIFYNFYNSWAKPMTFTQKFYEKFKNNKSFRIITENDLFVILPDIYLEKNSELYKNKITKFPFFTVMNFFNFDVPSNKTFSINSTIKKNKPCDWNLFYLVFEEYITKYKIENQELEESLTKFSNLIENKDLDFEYYQTLYKKTKRNIIFSFFRDIIYSSRETNFNILE